MLKTSLTLAAILTMAALGDPAKAPAKKDAPVAKKEAKAAPAKKKEEAKKAPEKPKNSKLEQARKDQEELTLHNALAAEKSKNETNENQ